MPARPVTSCFVDTNIWLYAFIESDDPTKSAAARGLIAEIEPIVSVQVVNEVCVNLLRRAAFSEDQIGRLISSFYQRYVVVELGQPVMMEASRLRSRYSLSFWDSMIVAAALQAGASVLYSEDMQHGWQLEEQLRVLDPFRSS
jgi:predicted nucleic acid-binding protein